MLNDDTYLLLTGLVELYVPELLAIVPLNLFIQSSSSFFLYFLFI